jgi:opacity protein-like surface antigen
MRRIAATAIMLMATSAMGQVVPAGFRQVQSFWVGGEYSNIRASFPYQSNQRLAGAGAFVDFNWNGHIGVEADARFLHFGDFHGVTESSYLGGPRYLLPQWHHLQPYGKTLIGVGNIHYPFNIGNASYFAVAPGAGINYRASHRVTFRVEYEYQQWLNSPGFSNEPDHPLHPNGFHAGIAYRPFH